MSNTNLRDLILGVFYYVLTSCLNVWQMDTTYNFSQFLSYYLLFVKLKVIVCGEAETYSEDKTRS